MMIKDTRDCFERVYLAMQALCGSASLDQRLGYAYQTIAPLLVSDFPTSKLQETFGKIRDQAQARTLSEKDRAELFISLYTQAARLDGIHQQLFDEFDE